MTKGKPKFCNFICWRLVFTLKYVSAEFIRSWNRLSILQHSRNPNQLQKNNLLESKGEQKISPINNKTKLIFWHEFHELFSG